MALHQNELIYIKLLLSEHQPENIFEYIQNGICVTDIHSKIIYTNPAFSRITGYSAEELLGQNPGMLHSGRHTKQFYEEMWAAISDKGFWEGEIWNRKKPGRFILRISPFLHFTIMRKMSHILLAFQPIFHISKKIFIKN